MSGSQGPCPQCGATIDLGSTRFCPECDAYTGWVEAPEEDEEATLVRRPDEEPEEPEPEPPPPEEEPTVPLGPPCPACGEPNPPGRTYCVRCGQLLAPQPEPEPEPAPPPPFWQRMPIWGWLVVGAVVLLAGLLAIDVLGGGGEEPDPPTTAAPGSETTVPSEGEAPADGEAPPDEEAPVETEVLSTSDVQAGHLASPPAIDGDLDDWSAVTRAYSLDHQVHPEFAPWTDQEDLSVRWKLGWDEELLYVAVVFEDDVHVQNQTGDQIWRGDSVDLHLDTVLGGEGDHPSLNDQDDFEIIFSPGDFADLPPSAALLRGTSGGISFFETVDHGALFDIAARGLGAAGFTLEAAVPWSLLEVTPEPGLVIGAALNASDNDRPGEAVQEVMISDAPHRQLGDPSTWGTLTLVGVD